MPSLTTRINLTGDYATAVELAAKSEGVSQAEIVRQALRAYWGEGLENAPHEQVNRSTVHLSPRSTVQPSNTATHHFKTPKADALFSTSA